jgi:hypothetical protein
VCDGNDNDCDGETDEWVIYTPDESSKDADQDGIADCVHADDDGVVDMLDNCPTVPNSGQADGDGSKGARFVDESLPDSDRALIEQIEASYFTFGPAVVVSRLTPDSVFDEGTRHLRALVKR